MENIDFTKDLVGFALKGEHTPTEVIKNYAGYKLAREIGEAVFKVAENFNEAEKQLLQEYIKTNDVKCLFEARTMKHCHEFYSEECNRVKSMIQEFRDYLFSGTGTFIKIMFGADRSDE